MALHYFMDSERWLRGARIKKERWRRTGTGRGEMVKLGGLRVYLLFHSVYDYEPTFIDRTSSD